MHTPFKYPEEDSPQLNFKQKARQFTQVSNKLQIYLNKSSAPIEVWTLDFQY